MENEFQSPRWQGRLVGLLVHIAKKNWVTFSQGDNLTLFDLIINVLPKADKDEEPIVRKLMDKFSEAKQKEKDNGVEISDATEENLNNKGFQETMIVLKRRMSLQSLLEANNGILDHERICAAEERKKKLEEEKERKKKSLIVWACIGAVILGFIIYNLPYFKEMRFYNEVKEAHTIYSCERYYREYPKGRHYEDVMDIELQQAEASKGGSKPIDVLTRYLHKFPDGKYATRYNAKCDSLWDTEIAKYNERDKSHESPEAVKFMTEMLNYMKAKRVNTVNLKINPSINLKDYSEYDDDTKTLLRILCTMEKSDIDTTKILSLKDNFTEQDRGTLVNILVEGVEKSFGRMFSSDFVAINKKSDDFDEDAPDLNINYEIKNQEIELGEAAIPNIWTYNEQVLPWATGKIKNPFYTIGYILGIDVKFETQFTIPGSSTTYTYTEVGEPGKEIKNIKSISEGYRRMTQVCFAKFSNKMSDNLGLEETYFRGDDDEDEDD